jgi:hypothetical protein
VYMLLERSVSKKIETLVQNVSQTQQKLDISLVVYIVTT